MRANRIIAAVAAVLLVLAGAAGGYWWAQRAAGTPKAEAGKKVLYWYDPMFPQQRFDKPGKSPFMDMQLVPKHEGDPSQPGVSVAPEMVQRMGVRTAVAERGRLGARVEVVGAVAFDERAVTAVQARTTAYVEQLLVRAPLDPVHKGQPLARLFVPEWAGAQQEYLALKSSNAAGAAELARAARNRLLLAGMSEAQIEAVDRDGKPVSSVTLVSPADGVIGELGTREGVTVAPGATLFRINGLATVWVNVEVPEAQAAAVRPGAPITATVPAYPGEKFPGRIAAVLPEVNAATRTVRARAELANPGARLKPGMFATVAVTPVDAREAVLIPTEAVISTGQRNVVVIDRGDGHFEPVDVEIGREEGGRTEVLKGIDAGTRVVASGQFLIDSEASLRGTERRMAGGTPPEAKVATTHHAEGRVEKVDADAVTISHGPVASIGWGAMTMQFAAPKGVVPAGTKEGDAIGFDFVQTPQGAFEVTKMQKRAGKP